MSSDPTYSALHEVGSAVAFDWSPTLRTFSPPTSPPRLAPPGTTVGTAVRDDAPRALVRPGRSPAPAPTLTAGGFRGDIEGLRAVAVVLVILYHFDLLGVRGGYVGVDVFFVISGFLITRLLVRDVEAGGSMGGLLATFYARRFRRLLPLATVVLLATVWAAHHWLGFLRGNATARDAGWAAAFLANVHFGTLGTDYLGAQALPSPLQHFWSLAVEEQFYVVWPLLVAVAMRWGRPELKIRRLRLVFATVVMTSFVWCVLQTASNGTWAYFSPLTRAWELAVGATVAVWAVELHRAPPRLMRAIGAVALVLMIATAFVFDAGTRFPGAAAAVPVLATAGVVAAGCGRRSAIGLLHWKPLQWIGTLSYSLYLWHWPVLVVLDGRQEGPLGLSARLTGVALAVALSVVSYRLVEHPIRSSRVLTRRRGLSLAFGAALVVVSLVTAHTQRNRSAPGVASAAPAPAPTSVPPGSSGASATVAVPTTPDVVALVPAAEVAAAVAAAPSIERLPDMLVPSLEAAPTDFENLDVTGCVGADRDPSAGRCRYGDPTGARLVVLFGDSHAGMWLTAAHLAAEQAGWQLRMFSRAGCPAPSISFYDRTERTMNTECDAYRDTSIEAILALEPAVVIVTSASLAQTVAPDEIATASMWQTGTTETLRRLAGPGRRLVLLGDMPVVPSTNPDCLAAHPTDIQQCGSSRAAALDGVYVDAEKAAAAAAGAEHIDVTDWFCAERCSPVVAGRQVYRNRFHITAAFGEFVAGALAERLRLEPAG